MCCLVVRVYCSLSHHLSQPSPLFLCSLTEIALCVVVSFSWPTMMLCLVNVSGACQAACIALQCCWHLWDSPPPSPLSRSHSISLKGSVHVHVSCYFIVTKYCPTDPGNERTHYGLIGGRWLLFRTRPLLAWIFQYCKRILQQEYW